MGCWFLYSQSFPVPPTLGVPFKSTREKLENIRNTSTVPEPDAQQHKEVPDAARGVCSTFRLEIKHSKEVSALEREGVRWGESREGTIRNARPFNQFVSHAQRARD